MTPNYVDSSYSNWTISPWCTCKGSGNQEEECMNFLGHFTDNTCLSESSGAITGTLRVVCDVFRRQIAKSAAEWQGKLPLM